jgi:hypothetical protein
VHPFNPKTREPATGFCVGLKTDCAKADSRGQRSRRVRDMQRKTTGEAKVRVVTLPRATLDPRRRLALRRANRDATWGL